MKFINIKISRIYVILVIFIVFILLSAVIVEAIKGKKRRESPPPPPPPCPIQSAGCYKTGDVKGGFGELSPSEFGYFLPENRCQKSGECDCRGVPENIVEENDPDASSGSCACIAGTDWSSGGRCCGDDEDDCGAIASGAICNIGESSQWISSSSNRGDIRYIGCTGTEYLSNGDTWISCGGSFWQTTIGSNDYICTGHGRESIIECCGDGSCNSLVDGKRLSTGQSIQTNDKTYYCRVDGKFVTDLDTPNSQISDASLNNKNKRTCEAAGFKWTGTKCCSEADDGDEYYNDPGTIGGCWNRALVISVDFVKDTDNSIVNYNGEFHGCAIDKTNYNTKNDGLLSIPDKHTGAALITNHEYCFNDPEKNFFCSYTEKWLQTDGADKTHLSLAPIQNPKQQGECCASSECWDGEKCVENMRANPLAQPIGDNSRCIDGEWTESELRVTVDQGASGYCPKKTQCLVNVFGKDEQSQCFDTGEYFDDNYCEDGLWTSRTKLLALKLLKLKSGDYTLFCDNRENTLNNLQYITETNEIVANVLTNIQTNNFCVLKAGNKVIAATSINKNLEEVPPNTLDIFGVTNCDVALIDDGQYHSCDATNKAWFNMKLKSFIYSSSVITIPSEQEPFSFITDLIKIVIDSIKRLVTKPPFDESYLRGIKKFDKLYITQQGNKAIIGTIEGKNFKNAVIEYKNFDTDICKLAEQFSQAKKDVSSGIECKKEGNNYYVLVQGSQFTNINPEAIWTDFTAKLRLK